MSTDKDTTPTPASLAPGAKYRGAVVEVSLSLQV